MIISKLYNSKWLNRMKLAFLRAHMCLTMKYFWNLHWHVHNHFDFIQHFGFKIHTFNITPRILAITFVHENNVNFKCKLCISIV